MKVETGVIARISAFCLVRVLPAQGIRGDTIRHWTRRSGRGFFAGAVHDVKDMTDGDGRSNHPRFQPENLARNLKLLGQFEAFAQEKTATPAQLALAWLLAQGNDIFPIPSNKTRRHLEENIRRRISG